MSCARPQLAASPDVLRSDAAAYTLGSGIEGFVERANLNKLAGSGKLVGNENANNPVGNSTDNVLLGGSGDDVLNEGLGRDTMNGGHGDDTFMVDTATDKVKDFSGQGRDLVRAETDFTLTDGGVSAFIENLRLQAGFGNIDGAGNNLDNTLQENTGGNALRGLSGSDSIEGRDGDDSLYGGSGSDRLAMESGNILFGGSGGDSFHFDGASLGSGGSGGPVIRDFDADAGDRLVFANGLEVGSFTYIEAAAFSRWRRLGSPLRWNPTDSGRSGRRRHQQRQSDHRSGLPLAVAGNLSAQRSEPRRHCAKSSAPSGPEPRSKPGRRPRRSSDRSSPRPHYPAPAA